MKLSLALLAISRLEGIYGDRLDNLSKDYDIRKIDSEWEEDDDVDIEDLPHWDERRPKKGMDTTKLDGRDHVTTWSESKKGQQLGLYVTVVPGMTEQEMAETFDVWQLNMINCCQFELTFLPIEGDKMLVLLPDGVYLRDFAGMLRHEEKCFTFSIENTTMLCKGHPAWDPKRPGKNVEAMEKWDDYHENKRKIKKKQDVEMWEETVGEHAKNKKIHMEDQIPHTEL